MRAMACLAALAILTGCQTTEDLQARVGNASDFQLCRAILLAPQPVASIAREEAGRRSLDCAPFAAAVFQNEAQANAARAALAQQLLANQPQPYMLPMPQDPINCRSVRLGNSVQTQCN